MFGWLNKKARNKKHISKPKTEVSNNNQISNQGQQRVAAQPLTGIAYYPELVAELKLDHRMLDRLQMDMKTAYNEGDLQAVANSIEKYGSLLRSHILKENMRLYIYLKKHVVTDPVSKKIVETFQREMDGIGVAITDFIEKYKTIHEQPASKHGHFIADLNEVSDTVHRRMTHEEGELFPLYAQV